MSNGLNGRKRLMMAVSESGASKGCDVNAILVVVDVKSARFRKVSKRLES